MPIVAIVGRPNVGKSSLFNRIIGREGPTIKAIVDGVPGVTRDLLYGEAEWRGKSFYVVDTGGILGEQTEFSAGIEASVRRALTECDVAVMVVDGAVGVTGADEAVADLLRRWGRAKAGGGGNKTPPVVVAVNKIDDPTHEPRAAEAYKLGLGEVYPVSATHALGIYDLMDAVCSILSEQEGEQASNEDLATASPTVCAAIVGRPNVGKSSLLNRLLGSERALVSPIAGTTRDPVDTSAVLDGRNFRLIDTAGLRRKSRMDSDVEYYSFVRALSAIDRADVALLVMDGPCSDFDKKIAARVAEKGRGIVLAVNKWDAVAKANKNGDAMLKKIREEMPFMTWAPVLFVSALSGRGVNKIAGAVLRVFENRRRRIPTATLNRLMRDMMAFDRLPSDKRGRALKISYCVQSGVEPPTFVFFVNDPDIVDAAFENHVIKELRSLAAALEGDADGQGGFSGSPVRVFWREKGEKGA
ncbi:MAG: ribosome biogenesis GTPase Der [Synergistaceae bacterium]|jgi:GTP-binding protein|nr:ribosome biogenesis GTPase Der [Synergistaceae bacterium]